MQNPAMRLAVTTLVLALSVAAMSLPGRGALAAEIRDCLSGDTKASGESGPSTNENDGESGQNTDHEPEQTAEGGGDSKSHGVGTIGDGDVNGDVDGDDPSPTTVSFATRGRSGR